MEDILSLEQQFNLAVFDKAVDEMTLEQARDYLKRCNKMFVGMREMYLKECARNLPVMTRNEFNKRPTA